MEKDQPRAALITIGTEILGGKMDDTNATWLSRWLKSQGITVQWRMSAGDSIDDIIQLLRWSEGCDVVFLTGGLGPTTDDCTRESLAGYLGRDLEFNETAWKTATVFYKKRRIKPPESNKRQAMVLSGGTVLDNPNGTAPGMYVTEVGRHFFLLPGPPRENRPMTENLVLPILRENYKLSTREQQEVRVYGAGESTVADLLQPLEKTLQVGSYFTQQGWLELHMALQDNPAEKISLQDIAGRAVTMLKDAGFTVTENRKLSELVIDTARNQGKKIAFAESITGGSCTEQIVAVPGASTVLQGSIIAYANDVKEKTLNVSAETLGTKGAVSEETVTEMVRGLEKSIDADLYAAVSGIAGPGGATVEKKVGLVWFGFLLDGDLVVERKQFRHSRSRIINMSVNHIYLRLLKHMNYTFSL
jgi:nicotinamide-nucleotide amidase